MSRVLFLSDQVRPRMRPTGQPPARSLTDVVPPDPPVVMFTASLGMVLSMSFGDLTTSDIAAPVTSWSWDFGDGTTSTAQNPAKVYAEGGLFPVSLTASNAGGSSVFQTNVAVIYRDGPFGVMTPTNSASWNALQVWGINVPAPTIGWACQEVTGTALFPMPGPTIAPVALEHTGSGIATNVAVPGWVQRSIGHGGNGSQRHWSTRSASLGIALSQSAAMFVVGGVATNAGNQSVYFGNWLNGADGNGVRVDNSPSPRIITFHGVNGTTLITGAFGPTLPGSSDVMHPWVWHRNVTGLRCGLTMDIAHLSGTNDFSLIPTTQTFIGSPSAVNVTGFKVIKTWAWRGPSAEQDWKQVLKWLHWPVTY